MTKKHKFTGTWQEAAQKWREGKHVWSIELGGFGPGYEQAIQILLFEIMQRYDGESVPRVVGGETYPEEFETHATEVINELNKTYGYSGAQVGAAKSAAYVFMTKGYAEVLNKMDFDRLMQVSKYFPSLPNDEEKD